jgi:hypothetical protein
VVVSDDEIGPVPLTVAPLTPDREREWSAFLATSPNATLFHQLPFLAYHPPDRFRFHHLLVEDASAVLAVVPGGLVGHERPMFTSPLGASVGGPVLAPGLRASQVSAIVESLQQYAIAERWGGLEFTLPPSPYAPADAETLSFALFRHGFTLAERWLCPVLPIEPDCTDRYVRLFRARLPKFVRAARRAGVRVEEPGLEGLRGFLDLFEQTYAKHGVAATHTPAEIEDLLTRLPQHVRLFMAVQDGAPVAGLLVFLLNARVAYTFYICASGAHPKAQGNIVAFAALLDWLGERGFSWLDLGPGASGQKFNRGVMFFKENLGAIGYARDRWRWIT